jgi:kynurenine formamidase
MANPLFAKLAGADVYDLEQPRYAGAPTYEAHAPGYLYVLHRRHEEGLGENRTSASGLIVSADHSGTHIDALCHQAELLTMFGGRRADATTQTANGFTELGVDRIAPIIARGVLLDVARTRGADRLPDRHLIGSKELEMACLKQGVECEPGDVLLIRTGNGALWHEPTKYLAGPGIGVDGANWLSSRSPLAVGVDNVAIDVVGYVDPEIGSLPSHVILLVRSGIYLIENLFLERLAMAQVYDFLFVCLPLKLQGATGSPVRPIAISAP